MSLMTFVFASIELIDRCCHVGLVGDRSLSQSLVSPGQGPSVSPGQETMLPPVQEAMMLSTCGGALLTCAEGLVDTGLARVSSCAGEAAMHVVTCTPDILYTT